VGYEAPRRLNLGSHEQQSRARNGGLLHSPSFEFSDWLRSRGWWLRCGAITQPPTGPAMPRIFPVTDDGHSRAYSHHILRVRAMNVPRYRVVAAAYAHAPLADDLHLQRTPRSRSSFWVLGSGRFRLKELSIARDLAYGTTLRSGWVGASPSPPAPLRHPQQRLEERPLTIVDLVVRGHNGEHMAPKSPGRGAWRAPDDTASAGASRRGRMGAISAACQASCPSTEAGGRGADRTNSTLVVGSTPSGSRPPVAPSIDATARAIARNRSSR
jgi:hypothetical protein